MLFGPKDTTVNIQSSQGVIGDFALCLDLLLVGFPSNYVLFSLNSTLVAE